MSSFASRHRSLFHRRGVYCLSVYTDRQYTPRLYELYVPMRLYDFVLIYEHWLLVIPLELDVLNQINFQVLACLL